MTDRLHPAALDALDRSVRLREMRNAADEVGLRQVDDHVTVAGVFLDVERRRALLAAIASADADRQAVDHAITMMATQTAHRRTLRRAIDPLGLCRRDWDGQVPRR